ncbi:MAG: ACT domain-containing protein, partial [Mangrovicoccus sp.]|nr:ACT domain-containing protein [Mangrovicoccus sp.]
VRERGIQFSKTQQEKSGVFEGYIKLTVETADRTRTIAGTVFSDGKPRFIQIKGINIDAEVAPYMLYTTNKDMPGVIGTLGMTVGEAGFNIANFTLGRTGAGEDAIALLHLDAPVNEDLVGKLKELGKFQQVRPLAFDVA